METAGHCIGEVSKFADIILIQEHWYFHCQLTKLEEVNGFMSGIGKAVDTNNPILPVQMPRGYGGVAVLWKKNISHLVSPIPDGGNRIQGIEIAGDKPTLLLSVYMPCKGLKANLEDYDDCLAQVHEILQKYGKTHYIIVGGDFNEDITSQKITKRQSSLNQLINENRLSTSKTGKTYVSPIGVETSTLDYVLHSEDLASRVRGIKVLDDVQSNVSDHYPVMLAGERGESCV